MPELPGRIAICSIHGDWWMPESDDESCPNLGCRAEVGVYIFERSYDPAASPRKEHE